MHPFERKGGRFRVLEIALGILLLRAGIKRKPCSYFMALRLPSRAVVFRVWTAWCVQRSILHETRRPKHTLGVRFWDRLFADASVHAPLNFRLKGRAGYFATILCSSRPRDRFLEIAFGVLFLRAGIN